MPAYVRSSQITLRSLWSNYLFWGAILLCQHSFAQPINLTLQVDLPESTPANEPLFVAGNFNNWQPDNRAYKLERVNDSVAGITIKLPGADAYEFKITRGGWASAQCARSGADVENYRVRVWHDTIIRIRPEAWRDKTPPLPLVSSKSPQVSCLHPQFYMPQLNRFRSVWIYLPPDYTTSQKHYPVLYMHDAQNLFDRTRNGFGEWGVDESLDSIILAGGPACIVVAVDHGGAHRLSEYSPFDFSLNGQLGVTGLIHGEGNAYVDFLVHTLKPYIDSAYRTMREPQNTFIAGSSMGGLISFYALSCYPQVFSKAGVFSPAFWTVRDSVTAYVKRRSSNIRGALFFSAGGLEGKRYADDMIHVSTLLRSTHNNVMQHTEVIPWGAHHESFWHNRFPAFYLWLFGK
jgi:metallo-beta-lactamase class B